MIHVVQKEAERAGAGRCRWRRAVRPSTRWSRSKRSGGISSPSCEITGCGSKPGRVAGKGAALAGPFDQFVGPVSEDVCRRFPLVHWVPKRMMLQIVIVAVVESNTENPDEVRKTTMMLQMKYGRDY
jgi:hypothetical protein